MLVSQVMHKDFLTVQATDSIHDTIEKMRMSNLSFALVLENDIFRGILTESELSVAIANSESFASSEAGSQGVIDDGNRCHYFNEVMLDQLSPR